VTKGFGGAPILIKNKQSSTYKIIGIHIGQKNPSIRIGILLNSFPVGPLSIINQWLDNSFNSSQDI
jgi:hypothetical protein